MTDYADMTNEQINLVVAQRLGYTVAQRDEWWHVIKPSGQKAGSGYRQPEIAWKKWCAIERWTTDLNAAAALDFGEWELMIIRRSYMDNPVSVHVSGAPAGYSTTLEVQHTSEPRARTIAWLLYMDAMEGNK